MAPSTSLGGLRVVVTGGHGALGRVVADELRARGAVVATLDRGGATGVDLTDAASTAGGMKAAAAQLGGGIDALVNIAGGFAWETLDGGSVDTWDRMYQMNLRTAVVASQQALPWLKASGRGSIVNVGALASAKAAAGMGAYAASKAGVARFTEALAEEHKVQGLRVNAVLPSTLDTPANRASMPEADPARWVVPAKLAAVIAFLLSDEASEITGALIPVAGRV